MQLVNQRHEATICDRFFEKLITELSRVFDPRAFFKWEMVSETSLSSLLAQFDTRQATVCKSTRVEASRARQARRPRKSRASSLVASSRCCIEWMMKLAACLPLFVFVTHLFISSFTSRTPSLPDEEWSQRATFSLAPNKRLGKRSLFEITLFTFCSAYSLPIFSAPSSTSCLSLLVSRTHATFALLFARNSIIVRLI